MVGGGEKGKAITNVWGILYFARQDAINAIYIHCHASSLV